MLYVVIHCFVFFGGKESAEADRNRPRATSEVTRVTPAGGLFPRESRSDDHILAFHIHCNCRYKVYQETETV
jgi:hypothetical protein